MAAEIVVVEDDSRFGAVLRELLTAAGHRVDVVTSVASARARARSRASRADLFVVDLGLPDGDGVELTRELVAHGARVIVLTGARASSAVRDALGAGASGFLYKEDAARGLSGAIDYVLAGGAALSPCAARALIERAELPPEPIPPEPARALTPREREVLEQLARGLTYDQVGSVLELSVNTVRSHVKTLYAKLDAATRTEAVVAGVRAGLIRVE